MDIGTLLEVYRKVVVSVSVPKAGAQRDVGPVTARLATGPPWVCCTTLEAMTVPGQGVWPMYEAWRRIVLWPEGAGFPGGGLQVTLMGRLAGLVAGLEAAGYRQDTVMTPSGSRWDTLYSCKSGSRVI
jgi:hypothetical protein